MACHHASLLSFVPLAVIVQAVAKVSGEAGGVGHDGAETAGVAGPVAALSLVAATLVVIKRQEVWGFYDNILSFQLTIWSIHTTPPVVGRILLGGSFQPSTQVVATIAWMLCSWWCRGFRTSPYSLFFLLLEGYWAWVDPSPAALSALILLQFLIVIAIWSALLAATCTGAFSVMPLDRPKSNRWRRG